MKLLPRYSLKWLLGLMGISALFFLAVSMAVNDSSPLASSVMLGVVALLTVLAVQVFFFGVIWLVAMLMGGLSSMFKRVPSSSPVPPVGPSSPEATGTA